MANFKLFDPMTMDSNTLPNVAGNYVFLLRKGSQLPKVDIEPKIPEVTLDGNTYQAIYTGIARKCLRNRDYRNHFVDNDASRSTLRKSIGSLFGYDLIPRKEGDLKYKKFKPADEEKLTEWMMSNLLLAFVENADPESMEDKLIAELNPPLNLEKNHNKVNAEFRALLSKLRCRPVIGSAEHFTSSMKTTIKKTIHTQSCYPINGGKMVKIIRRNVNLNRESNNFRCRFNDSSTFDILRVECSYKGETKVYEIESKYLSDRDSITFYAYQNGKTFTIEWQQAVAYYIKEIKL